MQDVRQRHFLIHTATTFVDRQGSEMQTLLLHCCLLSIVAKDRLCSPLKIAEALENSDSTKLVMQPRLILDSAVLMNPASFAVHLAAFAEPTRPLGVAVASLWEELDQGAAGNPPSEE